jgi:hypothetical protein
MTSLIPDNSYIKNTKKNKRFKVARNATGKLLFRILGPQIKNRLAPLSERTVKNQRM